MSDRLPSETQLDLKRITAIGEDCAQGLILASQRAGELSETISDLRSTVEALDDISNAATVNFAKAAEKISNLQVKALKDISTSARDEFRTSAQTILDLQAEYAKKAASENEILMRQITKLADEHRKTQSTATAANDKFAATIANSTSTLNGILVRSEALLVSKRAESRILYGIILLMIVTFGVFYAHVKQ